MWGFPILLLHEFLAFFPIKYHMNISEVVMYEYFILGNN